MYNLAIEIDKKQESVKLEGYIPKFTLPPIKRKQKIFSYDEKYVIKYSNKTLLNTILNSNEKVDKNDQNDILNHLNIKNNNKKAINLWNWDYNFNSEEFSVPIICNF